jgi:hypothetical protein
MEDRELGLAPDDVTGQNALPASVDARAHDFTPSLSSYLRE